MWDYYVYEKNGEYIIKTRRLVDNTVSSFSNAPHLPGWFLCAKYASYDEAKVDFPSAHMPEEIG